jgi:hypothetical protein
MVMAVAAHYHAIVMEALGHRIENGYEIEGETDLAVAEDMLDCCADFESFLGTAADLAPLVANYRRSHDA